MTTRPCWLTAIDLDDRRSAGSPGIGTARAERSVDRVLQLQLAAADVVRDVDDLDLPLAEPTKARRWSAGVSVPSRIRMERDARAVVERVVLALQAQVERIADRREVRLEAVRRDRPAGAIEREAEHLLRRVVREIGDGDERREEVRNRRRASRPP